MLNNLEKIKPFLIFDSPDDFYYAQVFQRRKDNPAMLEKNTVIIKNYFIRNMEYLDKKMPEIIGLCKFFNARAGIRLNKRSWRKVAFRTLNNITAQMMQDDFEFAKQAFSKAAGQTHNDNNKKWIVDLDNISTSNNDDMEFVNDVIYHINHNCQPIADGKILGSIPSKSGLHLITKPFNKKQFADEYPNIDIQCDNPTTLFLIKGNNNAE